MTTLRRVWMLTAAGALALATGVSAQTPGRTSETAEVAQGWALLAQGAPAKAVALARTLLTKHPTSSAVLVLAVDAEIADRGPSAALAAYEKWLGTRKLEEGYTLRRIARAFLQEAADGRESAIRQLAIDALAADGEPRKAPGGPGGAAADAEAEKIVAALSAPGVNRASLVSSLGRTGSAKAADALTGAANDPDPMVRAAAAEALADLGGPAAIASLKPLLNDPVFPVHLNAATALLKLGDTSGLAWLRELQSSEHAAIRVAAARATKSQADDAWVSAVRSLATDADPEVRREAAELLAPHDPEAARATIEALMTDANPAEREAAAQSFVQAVATDIAALRAYLHSADPPMRVRAAARILELTR